MYDALYVERTSVFKNISENLGIKRYVTRWGLGMPLTNYVSMAAHILIRKPNYEHANFVTDMVLRCIIY